MKSFHHFLVNSLVHVAPPSFCSSTHLSKMSCRSTESDGLLTGRCVTGLIIVTRKPSRSCKMFWTTVNRSPSRQIVTLRFFRSATSSGGTIVPSRARSDAVISAVVLVLCVDEMVVTRALWSGTLYRLSIDRKTEKVCKCVCVLRCVWLQHGVWGSGLAETPTTRHVAHEISLFILFLFFLWGCRS